MAATDGKFAFSDTETVASGLVGRGEPSWDYPRGPSGARVLIELAKELGLENATYLAGTGLVPADLDDPECVVHGGQELALIRNIVHHGGNQPGLGVAVGSHLTLGMLGIWGFAMLLSPTVEDVLETAVRHGRGKLSWIFLWPALTRQPHHAKLELDATEIPADVADFILERDLASTGTVIPSIVSEPLPMRIETTLPARRRRALAEALPHATITSHPNLNAFVFDYDVLRHRLPTADPQSAALYERQCDDLATTRARRSGLAGRITSALLRNPSTVPTLEQIAAERHVDSRSLRRHLDAEGTSFRELRNQTRHALAVDLLRSGEHSIAAIATRIGYSDAATFSRAFKQWTGMSPSVYIGRRKPTTQV
jgi:AraC-like DNA-binding protein